MYLMLFLIEALTVLGDREQCWPINCIIIDAPCVFIITDNWIWNKWSK
jgi:hypothetical protein